VTYAKFYFIDNIVLFIVPFDRNPNFIGRGTQLAELEEKLFGGGRTTKVAITGLGGNRQNSAGA
jgi:hypothetical protein